MHGKICINFVRCCEKGDIPDLHDENNISVRYYSKDDSLKQIVVEFEKQFGYMDEKEEENYDNEPFVHLWIPIKEVINLYVRTGNDVNINIKKEQIEEQVKNNNDRWVEIPDDCLTKSLKELEINNNILIMIEKKNNNDSWPRACYSSINYLNDEYQIGDIIDAKDTENKWYEAVICSVGKKKIWEHNQIAIHYIGWSVKWDKWISVYDKSSIKKRHTYTKGPHRYRPQKQNIQYKGNLDASRIENKRKNNINKNGILGFYNMGNTCYFNSALQCLMHCPSFIKHFEIQDKSNNLKNCIVEAWINLMREMYYKDLSAIYPTEIYNNLCKYKKEYITKDQKDSLACIRHLIQMTQVQDCGGIQYEYKMLDNNPIIEDFESLNDFQEKYNDNNDNNINNHFFSRIYNNDYICAQKHLNNYLMKNQNSKIAGLFRGVNVTMQKCLQCGKLWRTYLTFTSLNAPIKRINNNLIIWNCDTNELLNICISPYSTIQVLKDAIIDHYQSPKMDINIGIVEIQSNLTNIDKNIDNQTKIIDLKFDVIFCQLSTKFNLELIEPIMESMKHYQLKKFGSEIEFQDLIQSIQFDWKKIYEYDEIGCIFCDYNSIVRAQQIVHWPQILIAEIIYDENNMYMNGHHGKTMLIPKDVTSFDCNHTNLYQCVALSTHSGTRQGGHYTSIVRSFVNSEWYEMNDSRGVRNTEKYNYFHSINNYQGVKVILLEKVEKNI